MELQKPPSRVEAVTMRNRVALLTFLCLLAAVQNGILSAYEDQDLSASLHLGHPMLQTLLILLVFATAIPLISAWYLGSETKSERYYNHSTYWLVKRYTVFVDSIIFALVVGVFIIMCAVSTSSLEDNKDKVAISAAGTNKARNSDSVIAIFSSLLTAFSPRLIAFSSLSHLFLVASYSISPLPYHYPLVSHRFLSFPGRLSLLLVASHSFAIAFS
jgi:hypothetical protein